MLPTILLAAATSASQSSSSWTAEKPAVRKAVIERHGSNTQIDSILIKHGYALVHGKGFHDALQLKDGKWVTICDLSRRQPTPSALEGCGVPSSVAVRLAADEPVNISVAEGNFSTAASQEQQAYASATGPEKDSERVRMQELRTLNQQMQLQQITRQQAIQQWSQAQFSWSLP